MQFHAVLATLTPRSATLSVVKTVPASPYHSQKSSSAKSSHQASIRATQPAPATWAFQGHSTAKQYSETPSFEMRTLSTISITSRLLLLRLLVDRQALLAS